MQACACASMSVCSVPTVSSERSALGRQLASRSSSHRRESACAECWYEVHARATGWLGASREREAARLCVAQAHSKPQCCSECKASRHASPHSMARGAPPCGNAAAAGEAAAPAPERRR